MTQHRLTAGATGAAVRLWQQLLFFCTPPPLILQVGEWRCFPSCPALVMLLPNGLPDLASRRIFYLQVKLTRATGTFAFISSTGHTLLPRIIWAYVSLTNSLSLWCPYLSCSLLPLSALWLWCARCMGVDILMSSLDKCLPVNVGGWY